MSPLKKKRGRIGKIAKEIEEKALIFLKPGKRSYSIFFNMKRKKEEKEGSEMCRETSKTITKTKIKNKKPVGANEQSGKIAL
jgi:predicted RND superfamily exporter protein